MSKCALYRHFDSDGALLYVGISKNALCRLNGHRSACWYGDLATITVEHFDSRAAAREAETRAIHAENPIHNKQRYPGQRQEVDQIVSVAKAADQILPAKSVEPFVEPPRQYLPAGCPWLAIGRAVRACEAVMASGGDPYAAS